MSALDRTVSPEADREEFDALVDIVGPVLVLVDDAELMPDVHDGMQRLLDRRRGDLHVVAAGRSEALRSLYERHRGDLAAARTRFGEQLAVAREAGDRFQVAWAVNELGVTALLEVCPGGTLTGLAKRALPGVRTLALKTPADLDAARELIAEHAA